MNKEQILKELYKKYWHIFNKGVVPDGKTYDDLHEWLSNALDNYIPELDEEKIEYLILSTISKHMNKEKSKGLLTKKIPKAIIQNIKEIVK